MIVEGALSRLSKQTLKACQPGCCNKSGGSLLLTDGEAVVSLSDDRFPGAFECSGDESRVCCGFAEAHGAPVVVVGTLTESKSRYAAMVITRPKICLKEEGVRPAVSWTASGCLHDGQSFGADTAFSFSDHFCGCHQGRVSCRTAEGSCFYRGNWAAEGTTVPVGRSCLQRQCRERQWHWIGTECFGLLGMVKFRTGTLEVDAAGASLEDLASRVKRSDKHFDVVGRADPGESDAAKLASDRAAFVWRELVRLGVDARRIHPRAANAGPLEDRSALDAARGARVELVPRD